jgi:hypothetical protein
MDDARPDELERRETTLGPKRTRYTLILALLALWVSVCAYFAFMQFEEAKMLMALTYMLCGCVVLTVIHYFDWRCPACKQYLSCSNSAKYCPECGARLGN